MKRSSRVLLLLLVISITASCNKRSYLESGGKTVAAQESGHWVLVKQDPPTMFPAGYPADGNTESTDGEWIEGGKGVRWFVPKEGAGGQSQRSLTREALAMRSRLQNQQLQWQKAGMSSKQIFAKTLLGLAEVMGAAASRMGQARERQFIEAKKAKRR